MLTAECEAFILFTAYDAPVAETSFPLGIPMHSS